MTQWMLKPKKSTLSAMVTCLKINLQMHFFLSISVSLEIFNLSMLLDNYKGIYTGVIKSWPI